MTEYTLKNAQAFQVNLETASQIKSKAAFFIHASYWDDVIYYLSLRKGSGVWLDDSLPSKHEARVLP
jgi:hypothetical protein